MTAVNSTTLPTSLQNSTDTTVVKGKVEKDQFVKPETTRAQETEGVKANPKIITQIEASVLVTQTVLADGSVRQFPQEGVVEAYRKSQQDLATHQNMDIMNKHQEKA